MYSYQQVDRRISIRLKTVESKGKTYSGLAVDGKSAGSMYAGKIDIISNDKGAGVNTKGDLCKYRWYNYNSKRRHNYKQSPFRKESSV